MIARKLILPVLATLALSACAHAPAPDSKKTMPMNASAKAYRPHTLDEHPDLTPEEMGRRMLKLIDSLTSFDELSLERVREVTRLPLYDIPETTSHGFGMHLPTSGWRYVFAYYNNPKSPDLKNISYNFINKNEAADMAPVCTMDYDAYVTALKGVGFQEREDMAQYETYPTLPPRLNERTGLLETPPPKFRRLPVYFFTRKSVVVQITRWREADAPDEKLRHACVQSIAVR
ncbi:MULTISPECIES: hypothetical protein [Variovorax]|uniref:hypothetical protein n=1 Tax=Variovorax TaxID=34072 RepID=UPI002864C60A|nr:hypothetical protein [Variovorax sp. 3319]MDR6887953.1 hypothetical protein [Variovorax sp. 3319]